jgi:hypothetical protein
MGSNRENRFVPSSTLPGKIFRYQLIYLVTRVKGIGNRVHSTTTRERISMRRNPESPVCQGILVCLVYLSNFSMTVMRSVCSILLVKMSANLNRDLASILAPYLVSLWK